jgi:hypothetical protein
MGRNPLTLLLGAKMINRAFLLALILPFILQNAAAQEGSQLLDADSVRKELEGLCRTTLCRKPTLIRLTLSEGEFFEMTPALPTPILAGDLVTVYPGETVMIEAKEENDNLVELAAVSKINHPNRTLVFKFSQEPTIGDGTGMLLVVNNPFSGILKYRLGMMVPSSEDIYSTNVCPIHAGKSSYESWPHPIFQVVATDFRFVDPQSKEASSCD